MKALVVVVLVIAGLIVGATLLYHHWHRAWPWEPYQ